jgi:predicted PurR-regulated permease PerM
MARHDRKVSIVDPKTWEPVSLVRAFVLLVATLIAVYVCYLLVLPFLPALVWALSLAVLAAPLHRRLEQRLRHPNLSAAISLAVLTIVVILPLILVLQQLLRELGTGVTAVQQQLATGDLQRTIQTHELLAGVIGLIEQQMDLKSIVGHVATWMTSLGTAIVGASLTNLITAVLTFYLLFYFLRDRREVLQQLRRLSPLTETETNRLFERASDTIHAVIFGTVVTAIVQGGLGAAIFWLLGLPNPLFWGLLMALLAVVPLLGAFVIWIPAAAYLVLNGEWGKAALLAVWGSVVIGGADNILHPVLAGGRLHLHTIPMFISIVGGIALFGASGLILGPLVVALTITLIEISRARINAEPSDA